MDAQEDSSPDFFDVPTRFWWKTPTPNVATSMSEKDQNYPLPYRRSSWHTLSLPDGLRGIDLSACVYIDIWCACLSATKPPNSKRGPWSPQALNACHNAHSLSSVHRFKWHELFVKRVANQSNKKLLVKQAKAVVATYDVIFFAKDKHRECWTLGLC